MYPNSRESPKSASETGFDTFTSLMPDELRGESSVRQDLEQVLLQ
jgi:hypothetical protein